MPTEAGDKEQPYAPRTAFDKVRDILADRDDAEELMVIADNLDEPVVNLILPQHREFYSSKIAQQSALYESLKKFEEGKYAAIKDKDTGTTLVIPTKLGDKFEPMSMEMVVNAALHEHEVRTIPVASTKGSTENFWMISIKSEQKKE